MADKDLMIGGVPVRKSGAGKFRVNDDGLKQLMENHGCPPDVAKAYHGAVDKIVEEGFTFLHENVIPELPADECPGDVSVTVGTGNGSIEMRVTPFKEGTRFDPSTKQSVEFTDFGTPRVRIKTNVPKALNASDGIISMIETACAAKFGKLKRK